MSTVKTTNLQHPSASDVGITLGADGSVVLPQGFTGGIGSNVVSTVKTDVFTTSSTSLTDVTGLAVTITPTSNTSKVLVVASLGIIANSGADFVYAVIATGGTAVVEAAASPGDFITFFGGYIPAADSAQTATLVALASPATTSPVTYNVRMAVPSGTGYFNRRSTDSVRGASTLTAIEVAV